MTYSSDQDWVNDYVAGAFDNITDDVVDDTTVDGNQGWTDTATGWTDESLLNFGYKPRLF